MKLIKLTQGRTALVDDEDYEYLNQFRWCAHIRPHTIYAVRNITLNGKWKTLAMQRVILNTPPDLVTDHIDHNGLNNQRSNLRNCTHKQNNENKSPSGVSKYLGVVIHKKGITAFIRANGKTKNLGTFKTEKDAAASYDIAAKLHYGEFANLNFK